MKTVILGLFLLASVQALAATTHTDVTVCHLMEVEYMADGSSSTSSCTISIDSNDHSGSPGSDGISHDRSLGTLSSDCRSLPTDYLPNGQVKPIQIYDQGAIRRDAVKGLKDIVSEKGYTSFGNLGFDPERTQSVTLAEGGSGNNKLLAFYTAYDATGTKLGMFYFGDSVFTPDRALLGCYVN